LVFAGDSASRRIEARPNPRNKDSDALQREGVETVDVGSDLLLQFASHLAHAGFRVLEISLVDRFYAEADEEVKDQLEPPLRDLVTSNFDAAKKFKDEFLADVFVSDVRLLNSKTGNVVTLGQEGVVHASNEDIESLSAALNEAS
jgi:hypothetical protein